MLGAEALMPADGADSPALRRRRVSVGRRSADLDAVVAVLLGGLIVLLAVFTGSGVIPGSNTDLGANTWMEIVLTVLGAGAGVAVLIRGARGPAYGASALLALAAFTALGAISIAWSVQPDSSWTSANQGLAYLAVFAIGLSGARLVPGRWRGLLGALAIFAVAISAFALLGRIFTGLPNVDPTLGRLTVPLGYWNAIGLIPAMCLPAVLWAGGERSHPRWLRGLAAPAVTVLVATVVLSYSRSALVAMILCTGAWMAIVPTRLRSAGALLPGLAGAAVISGWALGHHALTHNYTPPTPARVGQGHTFGIVVVVVLLAVWAAGAGTLALVRRRRPGLRLQRRAGYGLLALASLVPLGGILALAASSRGLTGEVSHLWQSLTSTTGAVGTNPDRLSSLANSRPSYWHTAITIGEHHLLAGVGAFGYATARTRFITSGTPVGNAHSFMFETFSDLGLIGVAVMLVLLACWALGVRHTLAGAWPTRIVGPGAWRREGWSHHPSPEHVGMLTLLAVAICFGIQSAIDWTWYVPATAVPALLAAGWLAGRGPAATPVGLRTRPRAVLGHPMIPLALTATAVCMLALCWAIWQPLRAVDSENAAINAAVDGDNAAAFAHAHAAVSQNPFSLAAMSELASLYENSGNLRAARAEFVQETRRQPHNSTSWRDLGSFDLRHHRPQIAYKELTVAHDLNIPDPDTESLWAQAGLANVAAIKREQAKAARAQQTAAVAKSSKRGTKQ